MKKTKQLPNNQITIYQSPDGGVNIEVLYADENIWLTQKLIAQLFDCSIDNVSLHLKNIFAEGELDPAVVIEEYSITASDGKEYKTKHYSEEVRDIRSSERMIYQKIIDIYATAIDYLPKNTGQKLHL